MKYQQFIPHLNEQQRRLYAASEAMGMGEGGITVVHKASGISRVTITRGIRELEGSLAWQYYYDQMMADGVLSESLGRGGFYSLVLKAREELEKQISKQGKIEYQMAALKKINDYYKEILIFITRYSYGKLDKEYMEALRSFAKERDNTCFYNELSPYHDRFAEDSHPTAKGYVQIAGQIF